MAQNVLKVERGLFLVSLYIVLHVFSNATAPILYKIKCPMYWYVVKSESPLLVHPQCSYKDTALF